MLAFTCLNLYNPAHIYVLVMQAPLYIYGALLYVWHASCLPAVGEEVGASAPGLTPHLIPFCLAVAPAEQPSMVWHLTVAESDLVGVAGISVP